MRPRPDARWFSDARYGLFLHWGPYADHARGEQVLIREMMPQRDYERRACAWNPRRFDAAAWAKAAVAGGFRYAVFTTRHHDGYCMWDTDTTNYSSARQAAGRDFVREYVDAFRAAGLRVGLYYSWVDFRIPSVFAGPGRDPAGWRAMRDYAHAQVEELLTRYGRIDQFWFDGAWPRHALDWNSPGLVKKMRRWQPRMLINNRLGAMPDASGEISVDDERNVHEVADRGDFGTPEHHITSEPGRLWESCQVSTWRLWGHSTGDRWRAADHWLDLLTDASCKGGNLLLNVGPDFDGRLPAQFLARSRRIGAWLRTHGEAVYGSDLEPCDVFESTLLGGRQVRRGNTLYVICRLWHGGPEIRLAGLDATVKRASLLGSSKSLEVSRDIHGVTLHRVPATPPTALFPVLKLECDDEPRRLPTYHPGLWGGDPMRFHAWTAARGAGFEVIG